MYPTKCGPAEKNDDSRKLRKFVQPGSGLSGVERDVVAAPLNNNVQEIVALAPQT